MPAVLVGQRLGPGDTRPRGERCRSGSLQSSDAGVRSPSPALGPRCEESVWQESRSSNPKPRGRCRRAQKARLVYPGFGVPFTLLVMCFAAWGSAANLTDVLVGRVPAHLHDVELPVGAGAVRLLRGVLRARHPRGADQPAVRLQDRRAHRAGAGHGRRAAVHPGEQAARVRRPSSSRCSCWRPGCRSSRPRRTRSSIAMGPEESATQRLNLAQAFNPVGANIGVLLGAVLILPNITSEAGEGDHDRAAAARQPGDTTCRLVLGPYLGIAAVLVLIWAADRVRARCRRPPSAVQEERRGARRGVRPPVAQPPLPLRGGRAVLQRRRPGLRRGRSRSSTRATSSASPTDRRGLVPAGQPDPVPDLALRDDLPARHLPADAAAVRHGRARRRASR